MGMEQGPFPNPFFIVDLGAYDALSPQLYPLYSEISAATLLLLLFPLRSAKSTSQSRGSLLF